MFEVFVTTKKGTSVARVRCDDGECTLGKAKQNLVRLQGWTIGEVHLRMVRRDNGIHIEDGGTKLGTSVNESKVEKYGPLAERDVVAVGDYRIRIKDWSGVNAVEEFSARHHQQDAIKPINGSSDVLFAMSEGKSSAADEEELRRKQKLSEEWRSKIHKAIFELMDLRRVNINEMNDQQLRQFTLSAIREVLNRMTDIPFELNRDDLEKQVLAEAVGLGPLEVLLERDDISEIMVNAHDEIFYEQQGQLKKSIVTFTDDQAVMSAIERIVVPLGRRIDESSPMVDARLKDGSRVNAVIPPVSLKGPCISIRKFMKEKLTAEHLANFGSVAGPMISFLDMAVKFKKNCIISGGTGSGKTTLLNVLSNFIPDNERIVTVEDAAELKLYQPNLVALEARPPNQEGKGAVTIRELVKNCLRMRPDRIVVGECRGGEALDMLQAMNTGHDGSLTTVHANSPRDCISRMEVLVLMSGMDLPVLAIREQIASAVDIIIQQTRFACGSRRVTSICEVTGVESAVVQLAEIFRFRQTGFDEKGKVIGQFEATGLVPEFYEELSSRGVDVDLSLFERGRSI